MTIEGVLSTLFVGLVFGGVFFYVFFGALLITGKRK